MSSQGQQRGDVGGGADKRQLPHFSLAISRLLSGPGFDAELKPEAPLGGGGRSQGGRSCVLSLACLCNIWGPWAVLGWPISGEWKGSLFPSSCPAVSAETLPGAPFLRTSANLPDASLSLNGKKQLLKARGTGKKGRSGSPRPSREGGKRSCRRRLSPLIPRVLSSLPPSLPVRLQHHTLAGPGSSDIPNRKHQDPPAIPVHIPDANISLQMCRTAAA